MSTIKIAIHYFSQILVVLIFIRAILSWFPVRRDNPMVQLLCALTDPIINPIRAMMDKSPLGGRGGSGMMIDFSPVIALLLVQGVAQLLIRIL